MSLEDTPLAPTNQTLHFVAQQGDLGPTLLCSSTGSPPPSHAWQKVEDSGVNDVTQDVVYGEQGLAIVWNRPLTYEDSGYYLCNTNNSIGKSNVKLYLLVKSK